MRNVVTNVSYTVAVRRNIVTIVRYKVTIMRYVVAIVNDSHNYEI